MGGGSVRKLAVVPHNREPNQVGSCWSCGRPCYQLQRRDATQKLRGCEMRQISWKMRNGRAHLRSSPRDFKKSAKCWSNKPGLHQRSFNVCSLNVSCTKRILAESQCHCDVSIK